MKKTITICILALVLCLSLAVAFGCDKTTEVKFAQDEYTVSNGDKVTAQGNATYILLGAATRGVTVSSQGVFSIDEDVSCGTQVLLAACVGDKVCDTAICKVQVLNKVPVLSFENRSECLTDGEFVSAVSTPVYAVEYSLKDASEAVKINSVTGKISFSEAVVDGTQFTVVAQANGAKAEKTFTVATTNLVFAVESRAICEYGVGKNVSYTLDFGTNADAEQAGVLGVVKGHKYLSDDSWSYNASTRCLTLSPNIVSTLPMGDNIFKITTAKNSVEVVVYVATYITTARELAAINNSLDALRGHYILACDIDLTNWLSKDGDGYNQGQGWDPIGKYFDVTDGSATEWAFRGTFDGNGHTISGFFIERNDDFSYNSGFFGYVAAEAVIKNLGVKNAPDRINRVKSYSGGFVGVNAGTITDCWADVSVYVESQFKVVGGFVGRNEGTIKNCYSLGSVAGGSQVYSFAGMSQIDEFCGVAINCYAVKTGSYAFSDVEYPTCGVFASVDALKESSFDGFGENWNISVGQLPTLKSVQLEYNLREMFVLNTETALTRGDKLQLIVEVNPASKAAQFGITYEVVQGDGVQVSADGLVSTLQFQPYETQCTIKASCGDIFALYTVTLYEKATAVQFDDNMERTIYAGVNYFVDVSILPQRANQQLQLSLVRTMTGVTLDNGIISVDPFLTEDGQIEICATCPEGKSATLTIDVVANKSFNNNYKIIFQGAAQALTFDLSDEAEFTLTKVTAFDKAIAYTKSGKYITLDSFYFSQFVNSEVFVKFETSNGNYSAVVAVYRQQDVVEVGSVAEFLAFKTNVQLYDKVIILTADLNFGDTTITAVGNHTDGKDFTGIFNGNGHTISNLNIDSNDMDRGAYDTIDDNGNLVHRESADVFASHRCRYNVGLFSYLTGTVCNVNFVNVKVASPFTGTHNGKSYTNEPFGNCVGVAAGTVSGGIISNCTFTNCKARGADRDVGTVCGKNNSSVIRNCVVDGKLYVA